MQVVEHDQERHLLRRLGEQPADGIEGPKARLGRLAFSGGAPRFLAELGQERGDVLHSGPERELHLALGGSRQVASQDLHPRPVGRRTGLLVTAAPKGQGPLLLGGLGEHLGATRLTDARLAEQQQHLAAAPDHSLEGVLEQGVLPRSPHEQRFGAIRHVAESDGHNESSLVSLHARRPHQNR